jgi:hypothetical protein
MYLIYEQDYDNFEAIGFTKDEEYAKEYAEYFNVQYLELKEVPDKSSWEEKFPIYTVIAFIIDDKIQKRKEHDGLMIFASWRKNHPEGIKFYGSSITSLSYNSLEEAEQNLDSFIKTNKIRIRYKPTNYGGVAKELVSDKESN